MDDGEAIRSVLETIPDIEDLKPEQEACLTKFLEGKDVFGLLPTGFGKSLIYQLAPLVAKTLCKPNANANPIVTASPRHRQVAAISRSKRKQPPPGSKRISTARVQTLYEM